MTRLLAKLMLKANPDWSLGICNQPLTEQVRLLPAPPYLYQEASTIYEAHQDQPGLASP
jgi:hypothetical protein